MNSSGNKENSLNKDKANVFDYLASPLEGFILGIVSKHAPVIGIPALSIMAIANHSAFNARRKNIAQALANKPESVIEENFSVTEKQISKLNTVEALYYIGFAFGLLVPGEI